MKPTKWECLTPSMIRFLVVPPSTQPQNGAPKEDAPKSSILVWPLFRVSTYAGGLRIHRGPAVKQLLLANLPPRYIATNKYNMAITAKTGIQYGKKERS